jgi:hypothetical protein
MGPFCTSVLNVSKGSKKSKKENIYRSKRLTSGTHEPAASSTLTRRQDIEIKKASRQRLGVKNLKKESFIVQRG